MDTRGPADPGGTGVDGTASTRRPFLTRHQWLAFVITVGGLAAASFLLALGEQQTPMPGAAFRVAGTILLGLVCIYVGFRGGVLHQLSQTLRRHTEMFHRSEAETRVLLAALKLAGGLARADMLGWGGRLTRDEKALVEAVAALGTDQGLR